MFFAISFCIGIYFAYKCHKDIEKYKDSHGNPSHDSETDEYPLSISMLDLIKQSMLSQNLQPFMQAPTDISNNAKSDIQPNAQK